MIHNSDFALTQVHDICDFSGSSGGIKTVIKIPPGQQESQSLVDLASSQPALGPGQWPGASSQPALGLGQPLLATPGTPGHPLLAPPPGPGHPLLVPTSSVDSSRSSGTSSRPGERLLPEIPQHLEDPLLHEEGARYVRVNQVCFVVSSFLKRAHLI